jgi:DNA-binding NarL/FixJ family response regulator
MARRVVNRMKIQNLVHSLLSSHYPLDTQALIEASVHLPRRGTIFVASFTDESGRQIQRSTHQRNRTAAQALADQWETDAQRKRAATQAAQPGKPRIRVRFASPERQAGVLSHAEIAARMALSTRTVRKIEAQALRKLFTHPKLRAFWREHTTGEVEESAVPGQASWILSPSEIGALFALARTAVERRLLTKLLVITGNILL